MNLKIQKIAFLLAASLATTAAISQNPADGTNVLHTKTQGEAVYSLEILNDVFTSQSIAIPNSLPSSTTGWSAFGQWRGVTEQNHTPVTAPNPGHSLRFANSAFRPDRTAQAGQNVTALADSRFDIPTTANYEVSFWIYRAAGDIIMESLDVILTGATTQTVVLPTLVDDTWTKITIPNLAITAGLNKKLAFRVTSASITATLDPTSSGTASGETMRFYLDDFAVTFLTALSVEEVEALEASKLYPNPAKDIINVPSTKGGDIEIYSIVGSLVKTVNNTDAGSTVVSVSDLASGVYSVKIITSDSESVVKKLIIE